MSLRHDPDPTTWLRRLDAVKASPPRALAPSNALPFGRGAGGGWAGGGPIWMGDGTGSLGAFAGPYPPGARADYAAKAGDLHRNSVIASLLGWIVDTFGQSSVRVTKDDAAGNPEEVRGHDLTAIFKGTNFAGRPNPWYSTRALFGATVIAYKLGGEAYWHKLRNSAGDVIGARWIPSGMMEPVYPQDPTAAAFITGYVYKVGSLRIPVPTSDVVHFRDGLDPCDERRGWRRLDAGLRSVVTVNEADGYGASILGNMGIVPYLITGDGPESPLDEDVALALDEEWHAVTGGENRGRALFGRLGMQVHQLGANPEQLALDTFISRPIAQLCSLFGISPLVIGLNDDRGTYENTAQAREGAWEDALIPLQDALADQMQSDLLADCGGDPATECVGWDRSRVRALQEKDDDKANRSVVLWSGGVALFNEARRQAGLDPIEGADFLANVGGQIVDIRRAVEEPGDLQREVNDAYRNRILTLNEAREKLGLPPVDGGDDTYYEITSELQKVGEDNPGEAVPNAPEPKAKDNAAKGGKPAAGDAAKSLGDEDMVPDDGDHPDDEDDDGAA